MSTPGGMSVWVQRTPLHDNANGINAATPASLFYSAKTTQSQQALRNAPADIYHRHLDSSESIPSPHSSLYDATPIDRNAQSSAGIGLRGCSLSPNDPLPDPPVQSLDTDSKAIASSSVDSQTGNVHHPHQLDTIMERSSHLTLHSKHHSSLSTLQPATSYRSLRSRASDLHKASFSLTDLPVPPPSAFPSPPKPDSPILESPLHLPVIGPPVRIPTPPGIPTFGSPEAMTYRLPSPKLGFRDRYFRPPGASEKEWRRQTKNLPPGVVMRGDDGTLVRGRWRQGGVNGQTGFAAQVRMERHPFHDAPVARVAEGIGSETRLSPEERGPPLGGGDGTESVQSTAYVASTKKREKKRGNGWRRFLDKCCFVCCGLDREGGWGGEDLMMSGARPVDEHGRRRHREWVPV